MGPGFAPPQILSFNHPVLFDLSNPKLSGLSMTLLQVIKCHSSGKYFLVTIKILDNTMHLILKNGIPSQSPQLLVVPQAIGLTWAQPIKANLTSEGMGSNHIVPSNFN